MPKRPMKGTKAVTLEIPEELLTQVKTFAERRDERFREVVVEALRRHLAYPPPPPAPPAPLPPPAPHIVGSTEAGKEEKPAKKRVKK